MINDIEKILKILNHRSMPISAKIKALKKTDDKLLKTEFFQNFKMTQKKMESSGFNNKPEQMINTLIEIGLIHYELMNTNAATDYLHNSLRIFENEISYIKKTDLLEKLGLLNENTGNFTEAVKFFQKAVAISNNAKELKDIIYFSNKAGQMFINLDDYKSALQHYQKSYDLSAQLQDTERMSVCQNNIGKVYFCLEDYEKSLEYFLNSFQIREQTDDTKSIANSLNNIGAIYHKINNTDKALEVFSRAMKMHEELNNEAGIAISLNNMGTIYNKSGKFEKAIEYHQKSLKIRKKIGTKNEISFSLNNIGNIYKNTNKYKKALQYYHEALALDEKRSDKPMTLILFINLGNTYLAVKEYDKALFYLKKSLKISEEIGSKENLQAINVHLSDYYFAVGKYKKSLLYYKKFSNLRNELQENKTGKKLLQLQLNFELEQKKKENEIKRLENIGDKYSLISKDLEQRIERNFIGKSRIIKTILKDTLKAAEYKDTNVIITGESGTGKEIIARIIHHAGERKEFGFFPINCAAIPETLLESEFFGHKKGTFTGAVEDKKGLFELAHQGTLFLDEIADMPLSLQAKLLRAIEEKTIKRIGDEREILVDIRIIAATNQDIEKLLKNNNFRLDFYHRLNTLEINIPPLRERPEDIESLMRHFSKTVSRKLNKTIPEIDTDLFDFLKNYDFPGNVRELKNLVERALIICENNVLNKKCFPLVIFNQSANNVSDYSIKENEKQLIKTVLKKTNSNISQAAKILGISRHTLTRRLSEFHIKN